MSDKDPFAEFQLPPAGRMAPAGVEPYRPARWTEAPVNMVAQVRQQYEERLLATKGVTGIGTGPTRTGAEGILVYVHDRSTAESLPSSLEGVPVEAVLTGIIEAR